MRLSAFLLSLPRAISEKSHLYDSPGAKEYRAIVSSMQNRLDEGLSLGDFSRIHHLSKSYITKLFESYCGEGPMKYYGKLRILRVEELLLEGRGLQFIAERMNYSSVSYLSYSFKKIVGISVSNWLAKQRRNQRQQ
jgi:AraC-like DNA-binding protein